MKHCVYILITAFLLAACTPRLYTPQVTAPERYIYAQGDPRDTMQLSSAWWELFGDTTLNTLITKALDHNRDLAAAAARIEQARANLRVVRAQFLPQLGIGIQAGGDYTPATKIVQSYAIEPSLSWEVSLFGALRQAKRAAQAEIAATEWAYWGMQLSLSAEVATTYFTLLEYECDLGIALHTTELRREAAALIDSLFRYGMSDGVALAQAQSLVFTAEADIPRYRRSVAQARLSLDVLLGQTPQEPDITGTGIRLLANRYPEQIPLGLPSELLTRRPDVMEARYNVEQAAANAGAARSARFPSIILTGKGGVVANTLQGLTGANPWAWEAIGSLTQPIVAFGKLRRAEQAAIERYNQAAYTYEQRVFTAFADVEKALVAISTYHEQADRNRKLLEEDSRIATMTRALYRSGLSDYLAVIDAERSLYQSQMNMVNLSAQQYINYITLCKALGGGW